MPSLPKSVILVTDSTDLGGAEFVLLELLKELNNLKINCYLITSREGSLYDEFKALTKNQLILPFPYPSKVASWVHYFSFKSKVGKFIKRIEEERVILVGDYYPLWASLLVKESTETPVYSIWQGEYVFEDDTCLNKWIKYGANRADKLIASYPLAAQMNKQVKLQHKILPLNPKSDIKPFSRALYNRDEIRGKLGFKEEDRVAICVGRVWGPKGQSWLSESFLKNEKLYHGWHLMIVGPIRDEEQTYWNELKEQDFSGKLHLPGSRRDIPELLAGADLAIFPGTLNESFGLAVIEAMLMDLPILALRSGAIPYNLGADYTGLFKKEEKEKLISCWEGLDDKGLDALRKELDKEAVAEALSEEQWRKDLIAILA